MKASRRRREHLRAARAARADARAALALGAFVVVVMLAAWPRLFPRGVYLDNTSITYDVDDLLAPEADGRPAAFASFDELREHLARTTGVTMIPTGAPPLQAWGGWIDHLNVRRHLTYLRWQAHGS